MRTNFLRSLFRNTGATFGLVVLVIVVIVGLLAPWLAPYEPTAQDAYNRLGPPIWMEGGTPEHLLGTDHLGRDLLSRIIHGTRISLLVAVTAVLLSGALGLLLGLTSGYFGGWWENFIMRIADIQLAIPTLILALAVVAAVGPGLVNVILVLGVTGWVTYGRVVRGEVLKVKEAEYVTSAVSLGGSHTRILSRHIVPNLLHSVIVMASFELARMIVVEASLSFLGLGVMPPTPTWGGMVADGRTYIYNAWWLTMLPGAAIVLTVLGANLFGDWLRDMLDPQLR
jgi:peptide/nickel transport system permease protein